MKRLILLFVLSVGSANASTRFNYDDRALNLLTGVVRNCSAEFAQAMQTADKVSEGSFSSPRPVLGSPYKDVTTLTLTLGRYPNPIVKVSTFTMVEHFVPTADGKSWNLGDVECLNSP